MIVEDEVLQDGPKEEAWPGAHLSSDKSEEIS